VLAQAAGFAVLAAVSPTSLLVMAVFLGSDNPRRTALMYVSGAAIMTVTMAIVILFVLRATGLNQPREHDPRYGLRLALGVIALAAGVYMSRRKRSSPAPSDSAGEPRKPGLIARLTASPSPRTAFATGVLLFAPSATFIAAVQVIATANADVPITAAAVIVVVIVTVAIVWLPLITYLAFPEATTRVLRDANEWLRRHGRVLAIGALWIAGVVLVVNGALGIAR
jgi:threonine/homoserine/homoserine lactone efflux protein